jgi:hypothetical protein
VAKGLKKPVKKNSDTTLCLLRQGVDAAANCYFYDKWNLPGSKKEGTLGDALFTFNGKCRRRTIGRFYKKKPLTGVS